MSNTIQSITFSGFITNLGKYNEGSLIGEWVTFPIDEDELQEVFKRIQISDEPNPETGSIYEEYFFTDYECEELPELVKQFGEYESIDHLNEVAEALDGLHSYEVDTVKAIIEAENNDVMQAIENVDNYILYEGNLLDVAYQIIDECYPEISNSDSMLSRYFDYEAYARDLSFDGYTETSYGVLCHC